MNNDTKQKKARKLRDWQQRKAKEFIEKGFDPLKIVSEERYKYIYSRLFDGLTYSEIADCWGKDCSSIEWIVKSGCEGIVNAVMGKELLSSYGFFPKFVTSLKRLRIYTVDELLEYGEKNYPASEIIDELFRYVEKANKTNSTV